CSHKRSTSPPPSARRCSSREPRGACPRCSPPRSRPCCSRSNCCCSSGSHGASSLSPAPPWWRVVCASPCSGPARSSRSRRTPPLIMGGSLGALEAHWTGGDPGLWAAVSMGALMGGTMRAPFTATAFMLELTHDVKVLPFVFVACVAADAVTVLLMKRSILTEKVARRGHHVMREYIVSPLHQLRVADVMERNAPTVPASLPVDTLFVQLAALDPLLARRQAWPIVDDGGRLVGMLTRGDLVLALEELDDDRPTVLDAATRSLIVAYPDELLDEAT